MALGMPKRSTHSTSFLDPHRVIRICLVVSLFLHVILAIVFQKAFPLNWTIPEYRSYRVDFYRPPVENLDSHDVTEPGATHLKKDQPQTEEDAATVSLETKDERYVSYARAIKEKIQPNWKYPTEARKKRMEGKLMLLFTLVSSGDVVRVDIQKTSGHNLLDQEARRAILGSAPFPPFPDHIAFKKLHIKAEFDYKITSRE